MLNQHTSTGKYLHHHSDPLGNKFHAPCPTLEHEQAGKEKRSRSKADDTLAGNNSLIGGDEAQFGRTRTKAASFPSHPPRSESRGLDDDLVLVTLTLVQERAKYMSIVTGEPTPSASKPPSSELEVTRKVLQPCFGPGTRYRCRPGEVRRSARPPTQEMPLKTLFQTSM